MSTELPPKDSKAFAQGYEFVVRSEFFPPNYMSGTFLFDPTTSPSFEYAYEEPSQPTFLELEKYYGTKIIDMNESDHVMAQAGEHQRIGTHGLGGCTAMGVVGLFPDGTRRAYVQHFDSFYAITDSLGKSSAEQMHLKIEAQAGNYDRASAVHAVIMTPGEYMVQDGKHILIPKNKDHVARLTDRLYQEFGENTIVTSAPYDLDESYNANPYEKTLIIDLPAEGPPTLHPELETIHL